MRMAWAPIPVLHINGTTNVKHDWFFNNKLIPVLVPFPVLKLTHDLDLVLTNPDWN
jgi:hypothetical protein